MTTLPPERGGVQTAEDLPRLLHGDDDGLSVTPAVVPVRPSQATKRRRRRSRRAARSATRPAVAELALAALAVLAAAWPWTAVFAGAGWTGAQRPAGGGPSSWSGIAGPLVAVTVLACLATLAGRRFPWPLGALAGAAATVTTAAVLLFSGSGIPYLPGADSWRGTLDGAVHGWAYLLTITLPADARGPVAVTPVLITGLAAVLATLLVERSRVALLPLLAPILALLPALAFTAAARASSAGSTVVLVLAMLALGVTRTSRLAATDPGIVTAHPADGAGEDAEGPLAVDETGQLLPVGSTPSGLRSVGRAAFSVPVVVGVTAAAVALAPLLGIADGDERADPRALRHDEIHVDDQISPLSTLKGQLARRPAVPVFTVRVQQPGDRVYQVDRVRTAVLTSFDGATWSQEATYRRADSVLPAGDEPATGPLVRQRVLLAGLAGPYLPAAGRPLRVEDVDGVGVDRATGVLVSGEPTLAGLEYELVTRASAHGDRLTKLSPAPGPAAALDLPRRPAWIPEALQAAGAAGAGAGVLEQLKNIEAYLRSRPYYLSAPSGHSYFRIRRVLIGADGDDAGYAEQRASAFAVLARALGVPSRVCVGYLLRTPAKDGSYTVTSEDVHAWPEVNVDGVGWVAFDPTGTARTPPLMRPQKNAQPQGADNSQQQAPDADVPPVLFDQPDPAAPDPGPASVLARLVRLGTWLGIGALAFVVLVLGAKALRRRLRRRGGASARVLGAWREVADRLTEHGLRPEPSQTPEEVVRGLDPSVPEPALAALQPLTRHVSHALYAPVEPGPQAAAEAWALSRQACRELSRSRPVPRRLTAALDPRPLVPRQWPGVPGRRGPRTEDTTSQATPRRHR
ncbi:MAG: transglutaminaseTgpA domain-containing protein [Kineosporiaceae bacterium]